MRRLAAILSADLVGYSRLMEADEEGTLARLKALRSEILDPKVAEHHGRIVKTTGDGALAEFSSAVDAVACAVQVQAALAARGSDGRGAPPLELRIGINVGDVIVDGDDIYGDGVNVAARLEGLAEGGGICISRTVLDHIRRKLDLDVVDLGEKRVKNIAEPVHVFRVVVPSGPAGGAARGHAPDPAARPAVAVLPFTNLSGDSEQEYFADGLSEDIIAALSAWRYFPVLSRNSSFVYKNRAVDVRQVARELGVRYVLEGSVRKAGDRVRITATLVDAEADETVWAGRFDRGLADIFELQDEITQRIAATVAPELEKVEGRRSAAKRTASLDAWDYCQRGVALLHRFTKEGNAQARTMFQRAIDLDPDYSKAFTGLAYSHHRDIFWDYADSPADSIAAFLAAARRAVALDDTDSSAHLVLGYAFVWAGRFDLAVAETRRAVELNPGNAFAHVAHGEALDLSGRPAEAVPHIERGLELNRHDPRIHTFIGALARVYLNARDYERAVHWARQALERRSDYPQAQAYLASALGHLGRIDEARSVLSGCEHVLPGFALAYQDAANNEHYLEGLRKAGHQG